MKLTTQDFDDLCEIAIEAAQAAGELITEASTKKIKIEMKDSGESLSSRVVTEVDRLSQAIILKKLEPTIQKYDLGLLTEEMPDDGSRLEKDYFWCMDPLDGTLAFTKAEPGYAVSIALVSREGKPIIGVVYDPCAKNLYHAISGKGAFKNKESWTLNAKQDDQYEMIQSGGAVMNACWVLESESGIFYKKPKPQEGGGCLWDYAATTCLFAALGAWVSDSQGNPLDLNSSTSLYMNQKGVLFATYPELAMKFLAS